MTDQSSTDFAYVRRKYDDEMRARVFANTMEDFVKRWAPNIVNDDGNSFRENAQFHSELHMLIRAVYTDAQAPLLEYITKIMGLMPVPASIFRDVALTNHEK